MTESLLTLVQEKQAEATRKVLVRYRQTGLPKPQRERKRLAQEVNQLIAEIADKSLKDRDLVQRTIQQYRTQKQVNKINAHLQRYLGVVIGICEALREMAKRLSARFPINGIETLEAIIAERQRWQEDLPEQLALRASAPVGAAFRERVAKALKTPPKDTDWRSLFE